jgi:predicted RNA-binding protein
LSSKGFESLGIISSPGCTVDTIKGGERMCEAHAFVLQGDREVKLLESVDELEINGDEIRMINIFGEQKIIRGKLKRFNNSERKILVEALE